MALGVLTRRFGVTQGRIAPTGVTPELGAFVFCLGSDLAGDVQQIVDADSIEVTQTADVTGIKLVRFTAHVRPPALLTGDTVQPDGGIVRACRDTADGNMVSGVVYWVFSWAINAVRYRRTLYPGRTLIIRDGAVDVSQLVGNQTIKYRLETAVV